MSNKDSDNIIDELETDELNKLGEELYNQVSRLTIKDLLQEFTI
jgi:hypothetical protein